MAYNGTDEKHQIDARRITSTRSGSGHREIGTTRSAFIRESLEMALKQLQIKDWEQQHIRGYQKSPQMNDEIAEWADVWADTW